MTSRDVSLQERMQLINNIWPTFILQDKKETQRYQEFVPNTRILAKTNVNSGELVLSTNVGLPLIPKEKLASVASPAIKAGILQNLPYALYRIEQLKDLISMLKQHGEYFGDLLRLQAHFAQIQRMRDVLHYSVIFISENN